MELHIPNRMSLFCKVFGKWVDSGILRFSDRELLTIDSYSKLSAFLTNIIFVESLLGKFTGLHFFPVILQVTLSIFFESGAVNIFALSATMSGHYFLVSVSWMGIKMRLK